MSHIYLLYKVWIATTDNGSPLLSLQIKTCRGLHSITHKCHIVTNSVSTHTRKTIMAPNSVTIWSKP